jgi:hypothetical protein
MSTIKWGQRCIARGFENCDGNKARYIGRECFVAIAKNDNGYVTVSFETGVWHSWPMSALEPIPETPNVWWPKVGDKVMHEGNLREVLDYNRNTHLLDSSYWVNVHELFPVTTTEITPEEAVKLLEQHTGKSFTIKSK